MPSRRGRKSNKQQEWCPAATVTMLCTRSGSAWRRGPGGHVAPSPHGRKAGGRNEPCDCTRSRPDAAALTSGGELSPAHPLSRPCPSSPAGVVERSGGGQEAMRGKGRRRERRCGLAKGKKRKLGGSTRRETGGRRATRGDAKIAGRGDARATRWCRGRRLAPGLLLE